MLSSDSFIPIFRQPSFFVSDFPPLSIHSSFSLSRNLTLFTICYPTQLCHSVWSAPCTELVFFARNFKIDVFSTFSSFPVCFLCSCFTCMLSSPLFDLNPVLPTQLAVPQDRSMWAEYQQVVLPSNHHLLLTLPLNHRSELLLKQLILQDLLSGFQEPHSLSQVKLRNSNSSSFFLAQTLVISPMISLFPAYTLTSNSFIRASSKYPNLSVSSISC